jgi:large subunit ribosomal protein L3
MISSLLGKKIGMTRVFDAQGDQVPVTVIQVGPCVVVQRKTVASDGYSAAQLGFEPKKPSRCRKPEAGHFKKAGVDPARLVQEVPVDDADPLKAGDRVTAEVFKDVGHVDVCGVTKGRGFQGVIRRHHMSGQPMSHGHTMHRRPGSVGMREHPGRILRNQRMPGHLGHVRVTTQNLRVVQVRPEDDVILVCGSVPGPNGGWLVVSRAAKKAGAST